MIHIPEKIYEAGEIGETIETAASKLFEFEILTDSGYSVLLEEGRRLKVEKKSTSWKIFIDRDNPIVFRETYDKNGDSINPRITCPGISVVQDDFSHPPFRALDIAIEIDNKEQKPIARWHLDWANTTNNVTQPGPLVHLQYGGHNAGYRELDHPLKVPRWCHPPMDLVLMCEVMAANFYEEQWQDLREDQNWNFAVSTAQQFCYSSYYRKFIAGFSTRSKSILHSMWATEWQRNSQ
ncbi:hypothetical protein [Comamonas odontotermitis]|uniref:hypothetical protein n=1 Tax=Comamonas odontotermitis TaxID=379895 RepID=UPI001CC6763C|nr:hypothetical protein [Comamonas odontotermitis]UBB18554.1 hypothetical protein LAD35_07935 [Comamonas odontotermitis]